MTIRKGTPWGVSTAMPAHALPIADNAALADVLRDGLPTNPLAILGGDLGKTLGVVNARFVCGGSATEVPLDVLRIDQAGRVGWAAAHVVVRRSWWRGPIVAAMNAQFYGPWDVAPRSHPNDGRFELINVDARLTVRDRAKARSRLRTASHLPHPLVHIRQTVEATLTVPRRSKVFLDGQQWISNGDPLQISIVPDRLRAVFPA